MQSTFIRPASSTPSASVVGLEVEIPEGLLEAVSATLKESGGDLESIIVVSLIDFVQRSQALQQPVAA